MSGLTRQAISISGSTGGAAQAGGGSSNPLTCWAILRFILAQARASGRRLQAFLIPLIGGENVKSKASIIYDHTWWGC